MTIAVGIGDEGMGKGRRGEEEHRPLLLVAPVVQVDADHAALDVMHLKKAVVAMHRHVAAEEVRQLAKGLVVHVGIGVTLVVNLANIDVGDGLRVAHAPYPRREIMAARRSGRARQAQGLICFSSLSSPRNCWGFSSPDWSWVRREVLS